MSSQGKNANINGIIMQEMIRTIFEKEGLEYMQYKQYIKTPNKNNVLIANKPYKNIFGINSRAQFIVKSNKLKNNIHITGVWQQTSGTAQDKLLYMFENSKISPEKEAILLIDGDGIKKQVVDWFRNKSKDVKNKTLHVMNIKEFKTWAAKIFRDVKNETIK